MMRIDARLCHVALVAIALAGCQSPVSMEETERTALGKADVFGSCATSDCNGPAADGNCYCDDQCTQIGDCCADKVELCDLTCLDFAVEFEARVQSVGGPFSEVVVTAIGADTGGADKLLGKAEFLPQTTFKKYKIPVTKAIATSGKFVLRFTGSNAEVDNVRIVYGNKVYLADNTNFFPTASSPRYRWVQQPTECDVGPTLQPGTPLVVKVANQISYRVETPEFNNVFLWLRVTDAACTGTNTGTIRMRWMEDTDNGGAQQQANVTRTSVLQDFELTTDAGTGVTGTLWLTSSRGTTDDPKATDGLCEAQVYVEYR